MAGPMWISDAHNRNIGRIAAIQFGNSAYEAVIYDRDGREIGAIGGGQGNQLYGATIFDPHGHKIGGIGGVQMDSSGLIVSTTYIFDGNGKHIGTIGGIQRVQIGGSFERGTFVFDKNGNSIGGMAGIGDRSSQGASIFDRNKRQIAVIVGISNPHWLVVAALILLSLFPIHF